MKLIKISVRIDPAVLEQLKKTLNQVDSSKAIRGSMNFTNNVAYNLFSGNLSDMFKRKKGNEEVDLYDNNI